MDTAESSSRAQLRFHLAIKFGTGLQPLYFKHKKDGLLSAVSSKPSFSSL